MSKEILRPQNKPAPVQEPVKCLDCGSHNVGIPATYQSLVNSVKTQPEQEQNEFILRGMLATLLCWHRLTQEEVEDLLSFAAAQPAAAQRAWVGLTDEEIDQGLLRSNYALQTAGAWRDGVEWATKQLKEKNT